MSVWKWYHTCGVALLAALAYYLLTEHRGHVVEYLPYIFFLSCPLMHLFMHRRHGHNHNVENKN